MERARGRDQEKNGGRVSALLGRSARAFESFSGLP